MTDKEEKVEDKENETEEEQDEDNPDQMDEQQKLFYFAKRGDVEGIKSVAKSCDISAIDDIGSKQNPYISNNTALHYAVQSGNLQCVEVLYNLEAKLDVQNKLCLFCDLPYVHNYKLKKINVYMIYRLGSTPLHIAASLGYTEITKYLIDVKANLESKNKVQNTPLHCAVYAGHVDTVKVILAQLDEPRDSLLEPNGVGMGAAKYTAHEEMKTLLRTYFPKRKQDKNDNDDNNDKENNNDNNNDVEEEEAPPAYDNDNDGENTTANPTEQEEDGANETTTKDYEE